VEKNAVLIRLPAGFAAKETENAGARRRDVNVDRAPVLVLINPRCALPFL
jgi:hypothetical protein